MVVNCDHHAGYGFIILLNQLAMKKYHLLYEFHGVERHLKFDSLFEFNIALSDTVDNPQVANGTIDFYITKA